MGSGWRTRLWLLAFLAFSSLADVSALQVMSAPNVLRIGTTENIFVECQDCTGKDISVEIIVMNHPTKTTRLASTTAILTEGNKFQQLGQIMIPALGFSKDLNMKQYVYLQAKFPGFELEKVILVSFQSGYIFIQTDKTLYTPEDTVLFRVFGMTPTMKPVNGASQTDASIVTEIVTPDGIILPLDQVTLKEGIYSGQYKLGEIVSPGVWKVVAKFQSNPQQSYSAEFEVKEYVLPSFEVKLSAEIPFFQVDMNKLKINIKATYLFGENVDGTAYVVFGVIYNGQKRSFPSSLQRKQITNGNGEVTLMKNHITQLFTNIHDLVGSPLYVAVSVLTENGGEMVEAELRGIKIVTSPYTINLKGTPKYFKPDLPFNVVIEVLNPDGTPAERIRVVLDPGGTWGLTAANGIARLPINTNKTVEPLTVTARTNMSDISQASATMTAHPYKTMNNSYIHIGLDAAEVEVGQNLKINFYLNQEQDAQKHITYLILSRGQLMKHGKHNKRSLTSIILSITKDMLPSFRIVAYYVTNTNEVVSDSVWVDVKDSCMGSLKLEPQRSANSYLPGKSFGLKVTGDPEAIVGLVAVDKGVFALNNKHRLTQKKVWDFIEKSDTGCTPGGGKDSMSVFYDAGLIFESNIDIGTPYRLELKCPSPSRRKRAITVLDARTSLISQYQDEKLRACCLAGMKDTPLSYNCGRRSTYIVDGRACQVAFLHCCNELEKKRAEMKHDELLLARSEEEDSYMDSDDIVTRTHFPESWLWDQMKFPACSQFMPNCRPTQDKTFPLKDSITTWQFIGISLSRSHGLCVADPLEVIVRKDFFIDLRLPYSAVRGEQIEIKAILHNYGGDAITVRLDFFEKPHLCSSASKRVRYRQEVTVQKQSTRSVPFIIIPMKEGQHPVEVKGAVKDSWLSDGIVKNLRVVPEGVLTKSVTIKTFNPAKDGVDGVQEMIMNSDIPTKNMVQKAPTRTLVSVTGREQISALVENAISGKSMGTLIQQPSGCGEQNMIHMTLPVIATMYLDKTNQWEHVSFKKRDEALQHIKTGYRNELGFHKNDGSFAVFPDRDGSTWLTAYVTKVFAMAHELIAVENTILCGAVKFLISKTQQSNGSFRDIGTIIHGEMIGDVRGTESDVSMTAFCLIALRESYKICNTSVSNLPESIANAVAYLEGRLQSLTSTYSAAITSYALANENKLNRQILLKFVSPALDHWPVRDSHLFTLEATAYALLALVKAKAFEDARPVVRWFNQQQRDGGGFGSTQATIMVYQAIAEYWSGAKEEDYSVNVDIKFAGRSKGETFNFNKATHYATRTSKLEKINKDVTVTASGTGEATVKMVSWYYALPQQMERSCEKFNLSVQLKPVRTDEEDKIYKLIIKVLYKDERRDATMSILDIGLLTGYRADKNDLKSLSEGPARTISRFEENKALSERGSLIIYLDKVSRHEPEEIAFKIHRQNKVGVLQPAAVSVYEYYDHQNNSDSPCVKFYHPERERGELMRLCTNEHVCACAEENCSMQRKGKIRDDDRITKICETQANGTVDYAYKVRVESFTENLSVDIYTMQILEIIKEGSDACQSKPGEARGEKRCDVGPLGEQRKFLSFKLCRVALNLKPGKTYLIMGLASDIHRDEDNQSYQYVLGENTWIEYWPTQEECQTKKYTPTCIGLEELVDVFTIFGCPA